MKAFYFLCLVLITNVSFAVTDAYSFETPTQEKRFNHLIDQFRCLVCQNQALSDSNAPLAKDLRQQIFNKIKIGYTDQQITDYLTERYGDFVLYKPPLTINTLVLWLAPILLLLFGATILFKSIPREIS